MSGYPEKGWTETSLSALQSILSLSIQNQTYTRPPVDSNYLYPRPYNNTATMVKLTEVEDEHFKHEKQAPTKDNVLLATDDEDEDYTDTG